MKQEEKHISYNSTPLPWLSNTTKPFLEFPSCMIDKSRNFCFPEETKCKCIIIAFILILRTINDILNACKWAKEGSV